MGEKRLTYGAALRSPKRVPRNNREERASGSEERGGCHQTQASAVEQLADEANGWVEVLEERPCLAPRHPEGKGRARTSVVWWPRLRGLGWMKRPRGGAGGAQGRFFSMRRRERVGGGAAGRAAEGGGTPLGASRWLRSTTGSVCVSVARVGLRPGMRDYAGQPIYAHGWDRSSWRTPYEGGCVVRPCATAVFVVRGGWL